LGVATRSVAAADATSDAPAVVAASVATVLVTAASADADAPVVTRTPGIATRSVVAATATADAPETGGKIGVGDAVAFLGPATDAFASVDVGADADATLGIT